MGAQLAGKSEGRGRRRAYKQLAEINVTPFVDVMLVLLIVFMVSAPLMTVGVPVDLPKTAAPSLPSDNKPLFITVDTQNRIYVQETAVELDNLVPLLRAITENNPEARVLVRGDSKIAYGTMLQVMGTISAGGFSKVGLVAELPQPKAAAR
ncbi:biopolymer transporter ExbD [Skermanella stibiiresistens SB22]|jgi:biopolymer transport protein TolR|uniref:Biopolymer transporter ExbD n=1 Tax=Skermanella stibiiresistens SB22 TaxID=1385369 RepID=W9GW69_9PROT|nr:biopolymer transporter ExbD [Skermanella stibiiresistens]EWY35723.1 biopolymer transporter ExbD [Skermanella stibiiresistens SB22]